MRAEPTPHPAARTFLRIPRHPRALDDPLLALVPKARRRFAKSDPIMARILKEHPPEARSISHKDPFAALVESIAHQQVSLAAGRAIFGRVEALGVEPAMLRAAGPEKLRAAGLSRPKVAYVLDLASRDLNFETLATASDEEVIATLIEVKGIGVWTAKMFLLFHLHRPDVFAPEDLGLRLGAAMAYGVKPEQAAKKMAAMRAAWSPFNSVAALALWNYRHVMMDLAAAKSPKKKPPKKQPRISRARAPARR